MNREKKEGPENIYRATVVCRTYHVILAFVFCCSIYSFPNSMLLLYSSCFMK